MITIRRAESGDCEAVFYLARAFATSFAVERSVFEASFSVLLESPDALLAVAADGAPVVGYVLGFDHYALYANGRVSWVRSVRRGTVRACLPSCHFAAADLRNAN